MIEVKKFEDTIATFFGAKYGIAVDSCTHAIELCLRHLGENFVSCPKHTYVSIPMTFEKLNLSWKFNSERWENYYYIGNYIIDAAVYWKPNGYIPGTYMCLSFQYKKHLNLGRGGMILLDNESDYLQLKKMSYDGRMPFTPWAEQNIDMIGYHYYMTPETALHGINKFLQVKNSQPKHWSYLDYPDISKMEVFKDATVQ